MRSHFLRVIIIALVVLSCSEEDPKPGSIIGKVTLYDKFDAEVTNKEGVTIEIFAGEFRQSVTTNVNGEFAIENILPGKYTINFKKDNFVGFDSLRFLKRAGIDSLFFAELVEIPPAVTTLKHIEHRDDKVYPWAMVHYNSDEWYDASNWFFFSKDPEVSQYHFQYSAYYCCSSGTNNFPMSYAPGLLIESMYKKGFSSGDRVYVVAYTGNSRSLKYHNEPMGYKNYRFSTFSNNPSNVISFVLP